MENYSEEVKARLIPFLNKPLVEVHADENAPAPAFPIMYPTFELKRFDILPNAMNMAPGQEIPDLALLYFTAPGKPRLTAFYGQIEEYEYLSFIVGSGFRAFYLIQNPYPSHGFRDKPDSLQIKYLSLG